MPELVTTATGLFRSSTDVFIVGAGPSGLACAIAAARRGFRVRIADSSQPPIDKACGEGLLPDTLRALDQLGLPPERVRHLGEPFYGIRFVGSHEDPGHPPVEARFPSGHGLGIRRTELHHLLVEYARALGVRFHWKTVVTRIADHRILTNQGLFSSRWIVGADGHQSRVRAMAGLAQPSACTPRIALRQHYAITPWSDLVEVHWADHLQAYVTPTSRQEICVAFIGSKKLTTSEEALDHFTSLHKRLRGATASSHPRGSVTSTRRLPRVSVHNIALLGDASGSVDAITGQGLSLAFRQALALGEAFERQDLGFYEAAHRKLTRAPSIMSHALLLMDRHPSARERAFKAFERRPGLFSNLLGLHLCDPPPHILGSHGLLASALGLLFA